MKEESKTFNFKSSENDIFLSRRNEVKSINIELTKRTSRNIDIITKYFDSGVFDDVEFIDSIKRLSIHSKFTKIRILIKDSEPMIKNGHRIIGLIQKLTSSIEVRKIPDKFKTYNAAFCIYDSKGLIYLQNAERYDGFANFDRPKLATELSHFFNEIWEYSLPEASLRRLYL